MEYKYSIVDFKGSEAILREMLTDFGRDGWGLSCIYEGKAIFTKLIKNDKEL